MVQNVPQADIDLTVSPSETIDWDVAIAETDLMAVERSPTDLKLIPGQRCDLTVRLRNNSARQLNLHLALAGGFPVDWFTPDSPWLQSSLENQQFTSLPFEIETRQTLYHTLSFTVPKHFFEEPQALVQHPHLPLRYGCELFLYATASSESSAQLVGHRPFQLHPRPEQVYVDFLPEIYQQSDFLGRFLSLCEQALEPSFEMLDLFWAYLNPLTAPKELVPFLAHWVAWPMNPRWTLSQQRKLIRHAVEIYQWRGTRRGLQFCLHLCTGLPLSDRAIHIQDADEAGFVLGEITLSDEPCLGGGQSHHFSVTLRPETLDQSQQLRADEALLRDLIEQEKPAFCTYELQIVDYQTPGSSAEF
ncbi:phage tail protein [Oscillatoria sp. CS-180]|uniref:phage tail protein n=1 Tax=Oscillatoria sp. CS-180 TaxID=3021720 RepID=UPI00232BEC47|nr:phage tail protein [Oscillatoria sp. CS-180]MDB9526527.1 phage tail protein [Oscillatoria sp. CS-180]